MDLVDRYLAAIGRQLPPKQAPDIEAELRDELMARIDEREAVLKRPLTRPELEALLVEFGHPLVVAGRYRKVQHLIGPEVFPFWWAAVKTMLMIVGGVYVVLLALAVAFGKTDVQFNASIPKVPSVAIYLFGVITLVCAAFERFGKTAFLREWKPSRLPPVRGRGRSRFDLAVEIAANLVFLAWWFGLIRFRDYVPIPDFLTVRLAPVWAAWRWPIALYAGVEIGGNLLAIARPAWARINGGLVIARTLFGVVILGGVLQAGHWVDIAATTIPDHALAIVRTNFDLAMRAGLVVTIAGFLVRAALEARRLRRGPGFVGAPRPA